MQPCTSPGAAAEVAYIYTLGWEMWPCVWACPWYQRACCKAGDEVEHGGAQIRLATIGKVDTMLK
eukprot:9093539-Heterocapsa_arctica.AAC.1